MPKLIDQQLLESTRKPDYLIDELLDKQLEQIEDALGTQATGLGNKVLSLFVQNGNRLQLSEKEVLRELTVKKKADSASVQGILDSLKQSGLLHETPAGNYELANNFIALRAYRKIEADNRVLRSIHLTIQDRMSREELLDEQYLNYMKPMLDRLELDEESLAFVEESRRAIRKQKRLFTLFVVAMFVMLITLASWALGKANQANKSLQNLDVALKETSAAERAAQRKALEAKSAEQKALDAEAYARDQRAIAEQARKSADSLRLVAVKSRDAAVEQRSLADMLRLRAERAAERMGILEKQARDSSLIYKNLRDQAQQSEADARMERDRAQRLSKIIASRNAAVRTLQIEDPRLRALVAMEAYNINREDKENGNPLQPDVFKSLYTATQALNPQLPFLKTSHRGGVRDIVFQPSKNTFYTTGSDGSVQEWPVQNWNAVGAPQLGEVKKLDVTGGGVHNTLAISGDGKQLLVAGEAPSFQIVNTRNGQVETSLEKGRSEEVFQSGFTKDGGFYAMSQRFFYVWRPGGSLRTFAKPPSKTGIFMLDNTGTSRVWSFSGVYSDYAYELAIAEFAGNVVDSLEDNFEGTPKEVDFGNMTSVAISMIGEKTLVAYGFNTGRVLFIEGKDRRNPFSGEGNTNKLFKQHQAPISDLAFSPDGSRLAVASYDGTVSVWEMARYRTDASYQPTLLDGHNSWALSLAFSNDGNYLLVGCQDGSLHFWNLNAESYASQLCQDLRGVLGVSIEERRQLGIKQRKSVQQTAYDELTLEEYRRYFGEPDLKQSSNRNVGGELTIPVCRGQ